MTEPARTMSAPATEPRTVADPALSGRNRRMALGLLAWIFVLVVVSGLVAWFRN